MTLLWGYLPRWHVVTFAYGAWCRLTLDEVGSQWGEGEWVSADLWRSEA